MPTPPKLGIIAGGGRLPARLIEACRSEGRPFFVLAIDGAAEASAVDGVPHACVRLGAVGEALDYLRSAGAEELVLAGGVRRPSMASVMPDAAGAKLLARLGLRAFAGDDALLRGIVAFLEEEGFRVIAADAILEGLVAPEGCLTRLRPDARAMEDIRLGFAAARAAGALDIGQAAVVEHGAVLGVEGAEGTDALIIRCAALAREKRRAVLVKAKKPGQEMRVDLPTLGAGTVQRLREAGMLGAAYEAGGALLLDRGEAVRAADRHGLFLIGLNPEETRS